MCCEVWIPCERCGKYQLTAFFACRASKARRRGTFCGHWGPRAGVDVRDVFCSEACATLAAEAEDARADSVEGIQRMDEALNHVRENVDEGNWETIMGLEALVAGWEQQDRQGA